MGKINLLGPFSKALDELKLSIGIFSLDHLESNFLIQRESINVQNLELNGKESQVLGQGRIRIPDQSIDFKMEVDLLKNRNISFSKLGNIGKFFNPVTKILNFNVTGTLQDQNGAQYLIQEIYLIDCISDSAADKPDKAADSTREDINASPAIVRCILNHDKMMTLKDFCKCIEPTVDMPINDTSP